MPIQVLMPALSPTMTEGKLAKWAKKEGEKVSSGDVIAEIETDKATMEVESVDEGTMGRILVPDGTEGVPVNTLIALLLAEGVPVHGVIYRGIRYDTGLPLGYLQAVVQIASQRKDVGPAFVEWLTEYAAGLR